jgi:hypothetical protein
MMSKDLQEAAYKALSALKRIKTYGSIYRYKASEQPPYEQVCEAITTLEKVLYDPCWYKYVSDEQLLNEVKLRKIGT